MKTLDSGTRFIPDMGEGGGGTRARHDGGERIGFKMGTIRNLLTAWVLTPPVSILLSGTLGGMLLAPGAACGTWFMLRAMGPMRR